MHRTTDRRGRMAALGAALLVATGCAKNNGPTAVAERLPEGDRIATIVRVVRPDQPFYVIPFPADPVNAGDAGVWTQAPPDDYRDTAAFEMVGTGHFESPESGAQIPILVQVGSSSAAASVRVTVDQARGTLGVFGLADHTVWLSLDVYRLRGG